MTAERERCAVDLHLHEESPDRVGANLGCVGCLDCLALPASLHRLPCDGALVFLVSGLSCPPPPAGEVDLPMATLACCETRCLFPLTGRSLGLRCLTT